MPLSGGAADKFGNRYEGHWTVYTMLRVLSEEAASNSLEVVGTSGAGVEFALILPNGMTEFHQVKRQNGGHGPWSPRNLAAADILSAFKSKLKDRDTRRLSVLPGGRLRHCNESSNRARVRNPCRWGYA